MEFYEFLEKIVSYIPEQFNSIKDVAEIFLSIFFIFCAAATCFFGHSFHKVWNYFFFFGLGFIVPVFALGLLFKPQGNGYYVIIAVCTVIGIVCSVFSKKLFRAQVFLTSFFMVFISLPSYISFLGKWLSVFIGFTAAIIAAILSIKYKYITVIVTTAFTGSQLLWNLFEGRFSLNHTLVTIFAIITALFGLAVQCYVERKELKETFEEIKERKNKIEVKIKH